MKWEYRIMEVADNDLVLDFLNQAGEAEWEFVWCDLNKNIFIFKRPKQRELSIEGNQALEGYFGGKVG